MNGLRPQLAKGIPEALHTLITSCWGESPQSRPSFSIIISQLQWVRNEYAAKGTPRNSCKKKRRKDMRNRFAADLMEADELELLLLRNPVPN